MQKQDRHPIEIIKNRLYFLISDTPPKSVPNAFYFNVDESLKYQPFYEDFGPLNIAKIWKYTNEVNRLMKNEQYKSSIFYHVSSTNYKQNTNAALLICCFIMIIHHKSAEEAWKPLQRLKFQAFRDAGYGPCTYQCTILDCLRGLEYGMKLGWFDFKKFNISEYENYEKMEKGDLNWIIPNKFIAFSSPKSPKTDEDSLLTPQELLPFFKNLRVTTVIRLNAKLYDRQEFIDNGIDHHDLYFTDGTNPPSSILDQFFKITQNDEIFGVHCQAGLGRTGSLIGCYAMKHYQFSAADFIGWIRICRPGSILGPQQHFLVSIEAQMRAQGKKSPIWKSLRANFEVKQQLPKIKRLHLKDHKMSQEQEKISKQGEKGQGERLVVAKKTKQKI